MSKFVRISGNSDSRFSQKSEDVRSTWTAPPILKMGINNEYRRKNLAREKKGVRPYY